jgi:two-component sensor histidine kinase/CheY-like chemotaxis protein
MRLTRSRSIDEYVATLDGRIRALSTAHKLLATSRWEGADLGRLVREEVAPYLARGNEKVKVTGPDLLLPPAVAQTIALALHELVTNAAKHGALSADAGDITIGWAIEQDRLELSWIEANGPRIKAPRRTGYGMRVIQGGIEGQLGGKSRFEWIPEGLRCTLIVPLQSNRMPTKLAGDSLDNVSYPRAARRGTNGQSILLVEDEPLISTMLADMLVKNGHQVDGPHCRLSEALAAATNNDLQAGILDINIHGQTVFPVADILIARKIPFVFVSGYSADTIEPPYDHIPLLQKPVEPENVWAALRETSKAFRH